MTIEGQTLTLKQPNISQLNRCRRNTNSSVRNKKKYNQVTDGKQEGLKTKTKSSVHYFCVHSAVDILMDSEHRRVWQQCQTQKGFERKFTVSRRILVALNNLNYSMLTTIIVINVCSN